MKFPAFFQVLWKVFPIFFVMIRVMIKLKWLEA
jgi:hypothetical protein